MVRRQITMFMDSIFQLLHASGHNKKGVFAIQSFLLGVNLVCSIFPLVFYFIIEYNIHLLFWMGKAPQYVNLLVTACFFVLNVVGQVVIGFPGRPRVTKIGCFTLFLVLGSILVSAGVYILMLTDVVSDGLLNNCGGDTMTARVEAEWTALGKFYDECEVDGYRPEFIQQCRGFAQAFPNRVYVNYIEDVENDYGCVGFCKFWSKPIFNQDADHTKRCATEIGEHVYFVGQAIGLYTVILGGILVVVGACLMGYDHL